MSKTQTSQLPVIRTQVDGLQEAFSLASGQSFPLEEDKCRPEWGPDTQLSNILSRYSPALPAPTAYGIQNLDADMTLAFQARERASQAFSELPDALRKAFGSWENFSNALAQGWVSLEDKAASAADVPSAAEGASPSEARQEV